MVTLEELKKLSAQSIMEGKDLVDLKTIHINTELGKKERIVDYISQIKNPYMFQVNGVKVRVCFSGKRKLDDCIKDYLL